MESILPLKQKGGTLWSAAPTDHGKLII